MRSSVTSPRDYFRSSSLCRRSRYCGRPSARVGRGADSTCSFLATRGSTKVSPLDVRKQRLSIARSPSRDTSRVRRSPGTRQGGRSAEEQAVVGEGHTSFYERRKVADVAALHAALAGDLSEANSIGGWCTVALLLGSGSKKAIEGMGGGRGGRQLGVKWPLVALLSGEKSRRAGANDKLGARRAGTARARDAPCLLPGGRPRTRASSCLA